MPASDAPGRMVVVGQFAGAHGVRGEFKLRSFTEDPAAVAGYGPLSAPDGRALTVRIVREQKPSLFVARAKEIDSREDCDAWSAALLSVPRARLPPPEEDEFYLTDLVGLTALTPEGEPAGTVAAVGDHGAGDVIELTGVPGRTGIVVLPFTREDVPEVDVREGAIIVVLPPADPVQPDNER